MFLSHADVQLKMNSLRFLLSCAQLDCVRRVLIVSRPTSLMWSLSYLLAQIGELLRFGVALIQVPIILQTLLLLFYNCIVVFVKSSFISKGMAQPPHHFYFYFYFLHSTLGHFRKFWSEKSMCQALTQVTWFPSKEKKYMDGIFCHNKLH